MKRTKKERTTISIRLTTEQHETLRRVCELKQTSKTGYLTRLAIDQARLELLDYAVREYIERRASLSELARKTGIDVPTIMDAVASASARDTQATDAFLSAAKALADAHQDPDFYEVAVRAVVR